MNLICGVNTYKLSDEDVVLARFIVEQRRWDPSSVSDKNDRVNFIGAAGEIALHRMLNILIDDESLLLQQVNGNTADTDLGDILVPKFNISIDVKTTTSHHHDGDVPFLYIQPHKLQYLHHLYVLMTFDPSHNTCRFEGAISGRDVRHPFFSNSTRGIETSTDIDKDFYASCFRIPAIFLGDLITSTYDIINPYWNLVHDLSNATDEIQAWVEECFLAATLVEKTKKRICNMLEQVFLFFQDIHLLSSNRQIDTHVLQDMARRYESRLGDPILSRTQWKYRCEKKGVVGRYDIKN